MTYVNISRHAGTAAQAVVGSIVWAFCRLKKPRSREMSVRSHAFHNLCPQRSCISQNWRWLNEQNNYLLYRRPPQVLPWDVEQLWPGPKNQADNFINIIYIIKIILHNYMCDIFMIHDFILQRSLFIIAGSQRMKLKRSSCFTCIKRWNFSRNPITPETRSHTPWWWNQPRWKTQALGYLL